MAPKKQKEWIPQWQIPGTFGYDELRRREAVAAAVAAATATATSANPTTPPAKSEPLNPSSGRRHPERESVLVLSSYLILSFYQATHMHGTCLSGESKSKYRTDIGQNVFLSWNGYRGKAEQRCIQLAFMTDNQFSFPCADTVPSNEIWRACDSCRTRPCMHGTFLSGESKSKISFSYRTECFLGWNGYRWIWRRKCWREW